jgi:molecular chaperone HscB
MLKVIDSAVPVSCWSCSVAHNESTLFCPHCSKIQPPPGRDYYSVFGIQPQLNLDLAALEREFYRLSRKLHPDRFACASDNEKQWSLADTALVNDAYRTLKDPLRRTEYLLRRVGAEPADKSPGDGGKNPSRVPADLLEEVFELNMQIEEMRMAKNSGAEDPELKENLTKAKEKFAALVAEVDSDLRVQWAIWDAGDSTARQPAQRAMVALLDRRRYLSNLVRDVNETLGA